MTFHNEVLQAIFERRSIRKFDQEPIRRDQMETILEAGRWSPSGLNNQPWRFMVIYAGDSRQDILADSTKYSKIVHRAGALIVVFLDKENMYDYTKDCQGVGACMQNMLLAVHSMGLGGVWLGEILNQDYKVMEGLKLDQDKYQLMGVVALGYPGEKGKSDRRDLKELLLEDF